MLASGAVRVDARDARGNSVLAVATQNNRKRIVKALVRAGADLDAQNEQGQTAMHFAHAYGYRELAEYLVRKGANPMVVNRHAQARPGAQSGQAAVTNHPRDVEFSWSFSPPGETHALERRRFDTGFPDRPTL